MQKLTSTKNLIYNLKYSKGQLINVEPEFLKLF